MSESSKVTAILAGYSDRDRLATILRLNREGHVTEDEAINLLTGDRNYYLNETLEEIQKTLKNSLSTAYSRPFGPVVYSTNPGTLGGYPTTTFPTYSATTAGSPTSITFSSTTN